MLGVQADWVAVPAQPEQSATPKNQGPPVGSAKLCAVRASVGFLFREAAVSNWGLKVGLWVSSDWAVPGRFHMVPLGVLAVTVCKITGSLKQQSVPKYGLKGT